MSHHIKKALKELKQESKVTDYHYLTFQVESKLGLLNKFFLKEPDSEGVSVILEEIIKDVAQLSEFCRKTENYLFETENPDWRTLGPISQANLDVGSLGNLLHRKVM